MSSANGNCPPLAPSIAGEEDVAADFTQADANTPTGLMPNVFQHFYNDQSAVEQSTKCAYIIMMKLDLENKSMLQEYVQKCNDKDTSLEESQPREPELITPEFFIKTTEPWSVYVNKFKGKNSLKLNEAQIANEVLPRAGKVAGTSWKNKSLPELMKLLQKYPLTDQDDINFVEAEYYKFFIVAQNKIDGDAEAANPDKTS
jgi:hypothetical protein